MGLIPACRPHGKSEPPVQIPPSKDDTTGNGKDKGADHPTITEASMDRQDKLTGARTAPGRGGKSQKKNIQQQAPPAVEDSRKGSVQRWEIPTEQKGQRPWAKAANVSPPWRIHPDGANKAKRGNESRRGRKGR